MFLTSELKNFRASNEAGSYLVRTLYFTPNWCICTEFKWFIHVDCKLLFLLCLLIFFNPLFCRRNSATLVIFLLFVFWGQEATVRTGHGTTDWFQIGKGVHQGCIFSPCLFNLYAKPIMRNTGLEEAQAGIKIAGKISITSDMQMTPLLWLKAKRRTKETLDESKRGEWKSWLKTQHSEN